MKQRPEKLDAEKECLQQQEEKAFQHQQFKLIVQLNCFFQCQLDAQVVESQKLAEAILNHVPQTVMPRSDGRRICKLLLVGYFKNSRTEPKRNEHFKKDSQNAAVTSDILIE